MIKALLVTLLLLVTSLQQGGTLESEVVVSDQGSDTSSLPTTNPPVEAAASVTPGMRSGALSVTNIAGSSQPTSWSFLQQNQLGGSSAWIYPNGQFQILPKFKVTTFTIKFYTDCPQSDVNFAFATTGVAFVLLNGNLIKNWALPYPQIHKLTLSKPDLLCGCNRLKIVVYNYYF